MSLKKPGGSRRWGAGLELCSADPHAELFPDRGRGVEVGGPAQSLLVQVCPQLAQLPRAWPLFTGLTSQVSSVP